jgi:hypothetical protein
MLTNGVLPRLPPISANGCPTTTVGVLPRSFIIAQRSPPLNLISSKLELARSVPINFDTLLGGSMGSSRVIMYGLFVNKLPKTLQAVRLLPHSIDVIAITVINNKMDNLLTILTVVSCIVFLHDMSRRSKELQVAGFRLQVSGIDSGLLNL